MKHHAVVVGASSGLGAAIGVELRTRGWAVSGISRHTPPADAVDRAYACDARDGHAMAAALFEVTQALGTPLAFVWCAGVPVMGRTLAVPPDAAREAFDTSFWAMERGVRAVLPGMLQHRRGTVLAILSLAALRAVPYEAYYAASKAAAARWLECVAHEVEGRGVRIKCLYPGYVDTGFFERGGWWGLSEPPRVRGSAVTPAQVARAAADLLDGSRARAVVGWRERVIVAADRLAPGLYDRVLRWRRRD